MSRRNTSLIRASSSLDIPVGAPASTTPAASASGTISPSLFIAFKYSSLSIALFAVAFNSLGYP